MMYVLLEYIGLANSWMTVSLEMIVLLEYINMLVIHQLKSTFCLYVKVTFMHYQETPSA